MSEKGKSHKAGAASVQPSFSAQALPSGAPLGASLPLSRMLSCAASQGWARC